MSSTAVLLVTLAVCWTVFAANHHLMSAALSKKTGSVQTVGKTCPDNSVCPSDSTCCQTEHEGYGCCSIVNAVCCSDGIHCCNHGYVCDQDDQACVLPPRKSTNSSSPKPLKFDSLIAAKPKDQIVSCSIDGEGRISYCSAGETCCHEGCCTYMGGV